MLGSPERAAALPPSRPSASQPSADLSKGLNNLKWEQIFDNTSAEHEEVDTKRPKPRHGHRCVFVDLGESAVKELRGPHLLSIFGGDRGLLNEFWALNVAKIDEAEWKKVHVNSDKLKPSAAFAVAAAGNKVYMYGGVQEGKYHDRMSDELYELDLATLKYRTIYSTAGKEVNSPPPRDHPDYCLGAAMTHVPSREQGHPGHLYVFGGLNHEHEALEQLLSFDLKTQEWKTIDAESGGPQARESCSMVLWDDGEDRKLVVYGGMVGVDDETRARVSDVWALHIDAETPRWEQIMPQSETEPYGRSLHSAFIIGDKMIVYGGWINSKSSWRADDNVWVLDLKEKQWEKRKAQSKAEAPKGRAGHGAAMSGGMLYIFGGNVLVKPKEQAQCGNDVWRVQVTPPLPATDFTIKELAPTKATLTWKDPFPEQSGGYTVFLTEEGQTPVETPVPFGREEHLAHLKPGTKYYAELVSTNAAGSSTWWGSRVVQSFQTPGGPPATPVIRSMALVDDKVTFGWVPSDDHHSPAESILVRVAVVSADELVPIDAGEPLPKKQKGRKSGPAVERKSLSGGMKPDICEMEAAAAPSGSLEDFWAGVGAESQVWAEAEKAFAKIVANLEDNRKADAGYKTGTKRGRATDHSNYTGKASSSVSLDLEIKVEIRLIARNSFGDSAPSEPKMLTLTKHLTKDLSKVENVPLVAEAQEEPESMVEEPAPASNLESVVLPTEGADNAIVSGGQQMSDALKNLLGYEDEEEQEPKVAATPKQAAADEEVVPETPDVLAAKASNYMDIDEVVPATSQPKPTTTTKKTPGRAKKVTSPTPTRGKGKKVVTEPATEAEELVMDSLATPVEPTAEAAGAQALESIELSAEKGAQEETAAMEVVQEPVAAAAPATPRMEVPEAEMEVFVATSNKKSGKASSKKRKSMVSPLPAEALAQAQDQAQAYDFPEEPAAVAPEPKKTKGRKSLAAKTKPEPVEDTETVKDETETAENTKDEEAAGGETTKGSNSWHFKLPFGTDISARCGDGEWYMYKALWYCDAELLDQDNALIEKGKMLAIHPTGFPAALDLYVFLDEEGKDSIRNGVEDTMWLDPAAQEVATKQAPWFNTKDSGFLAKVCPAWAIREEDLYDVRGNKPWNRHIWDVTFKTMEKKRLLISTQKIRPIYERPPGVSGKTGNRRKSTFAPKTEAADETY